MSAFVLNWASSLGVERTSWQSVAVDVLVNAITGPILVIELAFHILCKLLSIKSDKGEEQSNESGLRVVVLGYGRTGTYSTTLALNQLGFRTLHPNHWLQEPTVLNLWHRDIVLPSIKAGSFQLGVPDFQKMVDQGYSGLSDMPVCLYYQQLVVDFPDCQFILTTRSNPDVWFRSFQKVQGMTRFMHLGGLFIPPLKAYSDYYRWLFSYLTGNEELLSTTGPWWKFPNTQISTPEEIDFAKLLYKEHNQRVRETIPSDRLLEYQVEGGWEPLCKFLQVRECPLETPFPRSNSSFAYFIQALSATCFVLVIFYRLFTLVYCKWIPKMRGDNAKCKTS